MSNPDELWDLYAGALIEADIDGQRRCLRGPEAVALPAPAPIFVLTAHNPGGTPRDDDPNVAAQLELEQVLASTRARTWPATGRSRDASWSEPGIAAAGIVRDGACALGRRYGQLAVFELTDDDVHVVRCIDAKIVRTQSRLA